MLRFLFFYCALPTFLVASMYVVLPGPKYPATKGEVWPKPRQQYSDNKYLTYNPSLLKVNLVQGYGYVVKPRNATMGETWPLPKDITYNDEYMIIIIPELTIRITSQTCTILENAIHRYTHTVRKMVEQARTQRRIHGIRRKRKVVCTPDCSDGEDADFMGNLQELQIELSKPCETYPHLDMDERYTLDVASISTLKSDSIWGILRGLETFSQLFYISNDFNEVRINMTSITDYPRYPHRGLLLDTGRHYISLVNILIILDGMAMNKMNVFHWHIVDDQSFPFQSEKFPDLSKKGAYAPNMIYTKNDVRNVINYARDRGIRVIPEFDVPGHTASWGVTFPNVLTQCYEHDTPIGLGPMNPTKNATYKVIKELFEEVQDLFPDKYFHVGGDEVELECWSSNPEILSYMYHNNITAVQRLHALFMRNTIPLLAEGSKPIVWQEVFDNNVSLTNDTIVQVWKAGEDSEMNKILKAGKRVLYSSGWYLDHLELNWDDNYRKDPRTIVGRVDNPEHIIGGEACMWGEMVDDRNVISRIWPRASAVAERLWSEPPPIYSSDPEYSWTKVYSWQIQPEVYHRLEEHTCRMITRGVGAQPPSGPGFCVV